MLSKTYSDSTPAVSYKYDLINGQIAGSKGQLIETHSSVSTSRTSQFDDYGRPTEYQQITDGTTYTSKYTYNLSGALIEEEYPSLRRVKHEFDPNGDLERVWGTNGSLNNVYANGFKYSASGGIERMRLGNGLWETAAFNERLQVTELGLGHSAQNNNLWKVNYAFGEIVDENGNVDPAKNTGNIAKQTVSFTGQASSFVQTYKYDSLYRLTEAKEKENSGQNTNWTQGWTYDRYGNRDTYAKNGTPVNNNALDHPDIDQNTNRFSAGQGFVYDKNGNLTTDGEGRSFTFDGNNKQTEIRNSSGALVGRYFYDGDGRRIKKEVWNGQGTLIRTDTFVYSGGKLAAEYSTQAPTEQKIKYLTEDHLGTPRVITNGNGQVETRRDFKPFGEEIPSTVGARSQSFGYTLTGDNVRQKFTGYQKDEESGLDFAEARMYENRHGRFTAIDPLLASGKSTNPQTFNRFVYVGDNPVNRVDPTGEIWYMMRVEILKNGTTMVAYKPIWFAGTQYSMKLWDKGVYRVRYGENKGKWIALNPWGENFTVAATRAGAEKARQGYIRQVGADIGGGAVHAVADLADCATVGPLCLTSALTGHYVPTPARDTADTSLEALDRTPDESSDAYRVGYRGTNAMMAVGTGTSALVSVSKVAALSPSLYNSLLRTQKNSLSWIGRAFQKHSGRPGSVYKVAEGKHAAWNKAGQDFADELLNSADAVRSSNHLGGVDVRLPDGRGIRFQKNGDPYSLLEP